MMDNYNEKLNLASTQVGNTEQGTQELSLHKSPHYLYLFYLIIKYMQEADDPTRAVIQNQLKEEKKWTRYV